MNVVYSGVLYDEWECPHCGLSQKAEPRSNQRVKPTSAVKARNKAKSR